MRIILLIIGFSFISLSLSHAQNIQLDQRADQGVIQFLDELNNQRYLDESFLIQSLIRADVANWLFAIDTIQLNKRQQEELVFYKLAFVKDRSSQLRPALQWPLKGPFRGLKRYKKPDFGYYHQGEITATLNPIFGISYLTNKNGQNGQRRMGAEVQLQIGRIGLYGSLREVYEVMPFSKDSLLTPQEGAQYKFNADGSAEFSDSRGGITYGWKHGYIGLVRDDMKWGYGYYGSNILDINTAPFTQVKLHLAPSEWFKFDYFHGSLQSDVIDSTSVANVNGVTTFDYFNKFMAGNMLSVRPLKSLWLSLGNSIIYSSQTPEPTFFIPLLFFKSVDHYLNGRNNRAGGNAQMFGAISFRPIKGLHLYSTLYLDELSTRRMFNSEEHTNWFSLKSGFRWSNILPNTTLTFEYFRSNPMVYKHFLQTTDYTNAGYNMGHYLRDNAREFIVGIKYKPLYWLSVEGMFQFAEKGADTQDDRVTRDPETGLYLIQGLDYLANTQWIQSIYSFQIEAQPIYRLKFSARLDKYQRPKGNASYQIPFYNDDNTTVSIGAHFGF